LALKNKAKQKNDQKKKKKMPAAQESQHLDATTQLISKVSAWAQEQQRQLTEGGDHAYGH
jgi:hypothetical protein